MGAVETEQAATRTFRGYVLDPFQIQAIDAVEKEASVLVSAPTGTGKTLVADYVIERSYRAGRKVIYTAPIKALSNQKFKEFKRLLGEEHVGILTGDVVINPEATVLIMTTEIFRNLLHQNAPRLANVAYVIFDEIHYIDDPSRGSVWEESLIFMPPAMRFLGLSATIPNVKELARWIGTVQRRDVCVVQHFARAVPLEHMLFEVSYGFCTLAQIKQRYERYARKFGVTETGKLIGSFPPTTHLDLIRKLDTSYLPCLFFAFSRRRCEAHAFQLAESHDFLNSTAKTRVRAVIADQLARHAATNTAGNRYRELTALLEKGIGFHHAGLLPVVKDIVEELFEQKLIYVLYCTETFAVGLNFPCKSVCFAATTKWDGVSFRPLTNREYFQIAGRAGRRGIDERGYAITVADMNFYNPDQAPTMREEDVEPLQSRFALSYNTVLNLIKNYATEEIEEVLSKNFAAYQTAEERQRLETNIARLEAVRQRLAGCEAMDSEICPLQYLRQRERLKELNKKIARRVAGGEFQGVKSLRRRARDLTRHTAQVEKECSAETIAACRAVLREYRSAHSQLGVLRRRLRELSPADAYVREFRDKKALLAALDYIREGELTARGEFAAQINGQELVVTELFFRGVFHDWPESELNALAVSLDFEPRKGDGRARQHTFDEGVVRRVIVLVRQMEEAYLGASTIQFNVHLADAAFRWSEGARFNEILQDLTVDEGDIVYAFRRALDILRQVRNASADDTFLKAKLRNAMDRMDRGEVSILL